MLDKCTLGPLPTYIDVRWVEDHETHSAGIFKVTRASAQLTAQWLNSIITHAGLEVEAYLPDQLVEPTGKGEGDVKEGHRFKGALSELATKWGEFLGTPDQKLVEWHGQAGVDTCKLTSHLGILADLSRVLASSPSLSWNGFHFV